MVSNFKKKIYFKTFILIVAIAILIFFGVNPVFSQINQISQKLQDARLVLVEFDQQKDYLENLKSDCQKIKKENTYLSQILFEPQNVVNFIIALEKNADTTNNKLQIGIILPEKKKPASQEIAKNTDEKDKFYNIPFQLSLEGDFDSLMDFLVLLENMEYYVDVSLINIEAVKEKTKLESGKTAEEYLGNIITNIEIKVYTNQLPPEDFW